MFAPTLIDLSTEIYPYKLSTPHCSRTIRYGQSVSRVLRTHCNHPRGLTCGLTCSLACCRGAKHTVPGKRCGVCRFGIDLRDHSRCMFNLVKAAEYPGNGGGGGGGVVWVCRFWTNSETNGSDAAESHGDRVTHLCGAERTPQSVAPAAGTEQKRQGRRYGTCAGPRKQWIGKIIITLLRFLKTPVPTRDHRGRSTATVRRPASTWAGRFTPSTHRRPWEPWSRPAFLTLFPHTVCPCGTIQVCLSFITLRASSSSSSSLLSRPLLGTETWGNRADITSRFPGWKPPSLTRTAGKDSGQVFLFFFLDTVDLIEFTADYESIPSVSHSPNKRVFLRPVMTSCSQQYDPGCSSLPCQSIYKRPGRSALAFIRPYRHKYVGFVYTKHFFFKQLATSVRLKLL